MVAVLAVELNQCPWLPSATVFDSVGGVFLCEWNFLELLALAVDGAVKNHVLNPQITRVSLWNRPLQKGTAIQ